ncbi:hypothetical protein C8R43DRAFT_1201507 [Mycena crocata]|nr:hypothetical protein C8R43DRAFT_1201507 [Mycena crocata]
MEIEHCITCGSLKWKDPEKQEAPDNVAKETRNPTEKFLQRRERELSAALNTVDAELARFNSLRRSLETLREENLSSRSPIRRMPTELWSSIFTLYGQIQRSDPSLSMDINKRMSVHFPLMLVSTNWRKIVQSTPSVWSFIALLMGRDWQKLPVEVARTQVELRLARSGNHPLEVVITASGLRSEDLPLYSDIVARLLGDSNRINSLVLNMHVTFPVLPKLSGTFDYLTVLTISDSGFCISDSDTDFWNEITSASIAKLALEGVKPQHAEFKWDKIHELRTDNVTLLLERLDVSSTLRRVDLIGYRRIATAPQDIRRVRNSTLRSLNINCCHSESVLLVRYQEFSALEDLSLTECDHLNWRENVGPALGAFVSHTRLQSLTVSIDLAKEGCILANVFKSLVHLRTLNVSDFWTDADMTPISEGHEEHTYEFPLNILYTGDQRPVLPALEVFSYRVFPERFSDRSGVTDLSSWIISCPLRNDYEFISFSLQLDNLLHNRMNESRTKLKKFTLLGGGRTLDDFPSFRRRMEKYEKDGLVMEFDEIDFDSM